MYTNKKKTYEFCSSSEEPNCVIIYNNPIYELEPLCIEVSNSPYRKLNRPTWNFIRMPLFSTYCLLLFHKVSCLLQNNIPPLLVLKEGLNSAEALNKKSRPTVECGNKTGEKFDRKCVLLQFGSECSDD